MKPILFRAGSRLARRFSFGWHLKARTLLFLAASFCALAAAHAADTTPPTLVSLDFTPKTVDVSSAAQVVTVTAHITDDSSGVAFALVSFNSPSGNQNASGTFTLASGTATDGTYQATVTIANGAEPGTWKLTLVSLSDAAGNAANYSSASFPSGTPTDLSVTDTDPDTTPPTIVSLDFTPKSVDVSSASQPVTVTAHITDDKSGTGFTSLTFTSPSGNQHSTVGSTRTSGDANDGVYQFNIVIPKAAEVGTWKLSVKLGDADSNFVQYDAADTAFPNNTPTDLSVTDDAADATPPTLVSLDFTPKNVDVTNGAKTVTVTAQITDDNSGVQQNATVYFRGPTGTQALASFTLKTGTATNGTFEADVTIPQSAHPGTWKLYRVNLQDGAGNAVDYGPTFVKQFPSGTPTDLSVTNANIDSQPPTLVSLDFTPKSVDVTSNPQTVTVTAHLTDDNSGVQSATAYLFSPSGTQDETSNFTKMSGTASDGVYQAVFIIPQGAEAGTWKLTRVTLKDVSGNSVDYGPSFPTQFPAGTQTNLLVTNTPPDTEPPALVSLDFTPKSVDVSNAARIITVTAHLTDNSSGLQHAEVYFSSPSNAQQALSSFALTSGTATDGMYQASVTIPESAEAGAWKLVRVNLLDNANNSVDYGPSYSTQFPSGTPTDLSVTSTTADTAPPTLVSLDFTPKSVNVSSASQTVTVTAHLTDENTGVHAATVFFSSPSQAQHVLAGFSLSSGTATDGTYQAIVTIPESAEAGTWELKQVFLQDTAGNSVSYGPSFSAQLPSGTPIDLSVTNAPVAHPLNISTRMEVLGNDNVLIAGFIVTGPSGSSKKVMIRGMGPSLVNAGVTNPLADPLLELHLPDGTVVTNDNWQQASNSGDIPNGFQPVDPRESVIIATLPIGSGGSSGFTAILKGAHGETGIGLAEAYDLDGSAPNQFANISTRGFIDTGDNVMIGGFILGGSSQGSSVLIHGIGPSLANFGVTNALADPTLALHDSNGNTLMTNDNWKTDDTSGQSQEAAIRATTLPPSNDAESAILMTLPPGAYTAIVAGKSNATGVGLVEVFNLQP
jgi:hypothetical protein